MEVDGISLWVIYSELWHWHALADIFAGAGLFTLVVSVLCLLVQILVYIWIQELVIVKAVIAVVGIFGMPPLLHFLPIRRGPQGIIRKEPEEIKPRSLEEGTAMAQPPVTGSPHTVVSMLPS